ncbi:vomeronasal type-1 receptor 4-like [Castor canadensis]|jgi:vomeronasal1 receptor|uniref:Vomeronasal type-1 receptor 4-like n=1 Tax=Castor canadensis TaxID=51338 RepID=A0AC58L8I3_CASCN
MEASDVPTVIIFMLQAVVGILGNSFLLCHYVLFSFIGCSLKPTEFILKHLIVANIVTLLCKAVPQTMAAFGLRDFLGDFGCKVLFYFHRVSRSITMSSTCLLSVFQAITISPSDSGCAQLKAKAPKYTHFSLQLSWILYLLVNVVCFKNVTRKWNNENITILKDLGYCSASNLDKASDLLLAVFLSFPDVFCVGFMVWSSSTMVFILYRHKQRIQHLNSIDHANVFSRYFPVCRATKTILLLAGTFVFFYTLSCIFHICLMVISDPSWFLVTTSAVIAGCFPTVSPFLLTSPEASEFRFFYVWIRNRKTSESSDEHVIK